MGGSRIYLDYNATTPLRDAARDAMIAAMDVVGNPSSVHAEGRAAKGIMERARGQIAEAFGCEGADIIFTSSASEAAALALEGRGALCSGVEHDAVQAWCDPSLPTSGQGVVTTDNPAGSAIQLANSETGILQSVPQGVLLCDMTQAFGKIPLAFNWSGADMAIISAHKLGGPKGIGALVIKRGIDIAARIRGGGQEMGRRSGTENIIGIAGFGAAAQAAQQDLEQGVWQNVEKLRNILEKAIAQSSNRTIFVGKDAPRLPNTSYFVTPGWKGETQVMQMDLSGFAVSAGSACSSGRVKASKVLKAMGYDDDMASCAVRVSLGPSTTENDIQSFCDAWCAHYAKFASRHWGNNR
jgi:cysteine desulfurase